MDIRRLIGLLLTIALIGSVSTNVYLLNRKPPVQNNVSPLTVAMKKALSPSTKTRGSEITVVQHCVGSKSKSKMLPRHYLFLSSKNPQVKLLTVSLSRRSDEPNILQSLPFTDKNLPLIQQRGTFFEHGKLSELENQYQRRYDSLLQLGAAACISTSQEDSRFFIDRDQMMEVLKQESTHYALLDYEVESRDLMLTVYYEINGKTYHSELAIDLRNL